MYRAQRNYENLQREMYDGVGEYGIPEIPPVTSVNVDNWIGFNYVRGCEDPEVHGVHFFVDDYQFLRVWTRPDDYISKLRKFQAVCAPDFSTYVDFPKCIQIYNHYRKHWLAKYWTDRGIKVIPTISWSDDSSFDWCFDGEPKNSIVAVSSVGTQAQAYSQQLFIEGYEEMLSRLSPIGIIFYGDIPDMVDTSNVLHLESFVQKWRAKKEEDQEWAEEDRTVS